MKPKKFIEYNVTLTSNITAEELTCIKSNVHNALNAVPSKDFYAVMYPEKSDNASTFNRNITFYTNGKVAMFDSTMNKNENTILLSAKSIDELFSMIAAHRDKQLNVD